MNRRPRSRISTNLIVVFLLTSLLLQIFNHSGSLSAYAQGITPPDFREIGDQIKGDLEKYGKPILPGFSVIVDNIKTEDKWLIIAYYFASESDIVNNESLGIGQLINSRWEIISSRNPDFNIWLSALPSTLLSEDAKTLFKMDTEGIANDVTANAYTGHRLPWQGGVSHKVTTGVGGHSHAYEYWAYDFAMPNGTEIWASSGGVVAYATDGYGPGACDPNLANQGNRVVVNNDDGSASLYLHLQQGGAKVSVGQRIYRGDLIGLSGNSGYSCPTGSGYHLHFQVQVRGSSWWTQSQQVIFDPNGEPAVNSYPVSGNYRTGGGSSCPGPNLSSPGDPYVSSSQTISFNWQAVSGCTFNGYTFRIKTVSSMDSGGTTIVDTGNGSTSRTETIASQYNNMDLYWGVKAANAPNGANWSVRKFRIQPGNNNPLPSDYGLCAEEGQQCSFSGSAQIYYGAGSNWVGPRTFSDGVACSNDIFGDPISGTHKQCYIKGGRPTGSTYCAAENGTCSFGSNSVATVYYGVSGQYKTKTGVISSIACNNDTFGDPFSSQGKSCYYIITGSNLSTPSNPSPGDNATLPRTSNTSLSWNTNGTSCSIHIWGGSINITPTNNCSSLALGNQRGGAYNWQVTASNGSGSAPGPIWHFNIRPYGPTNLSISSPSYTQLTLNWTPSSDEPADIDSYNVYQNDQFLGTAAKGSASYPVTDLSCTESYSFYLRAVRQGVLSDPSNTVNRAAMNCPPSAPVNLTVSGATAHSLTLAWDDISSNETGFKIYRWAHDGTNWNFIYLTSVGANTTSFTQSNLICGSDFNFYEVSAFNANGESEHAGWVRGTTLPCPAPSNDDFGSPKNIALLSFTDNLETLGATSAADDPAMPDCNRGPGAASVWYQYTPLSNGNLIVDTVGSDYDTVLAVWTGARGSLTSVACNDDRIENGEYIDLQSKVIAHVTAGTTYYIEAVQFQYEESSSSSAQSDKKPGTIGKAEISGQSVGGNLVLHSQFAKSDLIVTAISFSPASPVSGQPLNIIVQVKNQGAGEAGEFFVDAYLDRVPSGCGNFGDHWKWIPNLPAGQTVSAVIPVKTETSDGLLQGNHQIYAYVDSECLESESNEANNIYGPASATVSAPLPAPSNDDIANPKIIASGSYSDSMDARGATVAFDDPTMDACGLNQGKGSVWYRMTPAASGKVRLDTIGSDYDTVLAIWSGSRGSLNLVACNDDIGWAGDDYDQDSTLTTEVEAGTLYYIEATKFGATLSVSSAEFRPTEIRAEGKDALATGDITNLSGGNLVLHVSGSPISITIGGAPMGSHLLPSREQQRISYTGINNGPVKIQSTNGQPIVASERVAYSPDGGTTWSSYSELMGLPSNQLTTSYVLPWYNNVELNTQLRFGNVGTANTTVTVKVGGVTRGTYLLAPSQSTRVSYTGLNSGPVVISSSGGVPIIASERVAYHDGTAWTSFSELMGLPSNKLTTSYTLPWYNNVDLNTQLRFGNVGTAKTIVTVKVGGVTRGTYSLAPNQSTRVSYAGLNGGPVVISSSGGVPIIASERVAYFDGSNWTEFSELMALPTNQLTTTYWMPVYNNVDLNTQLRFGNVGSAGTTVSVTVGGIVQGSYFLAPSQAVRISYAGLDGGPVKISSSGGVPIIASERVAYFDGSAWTSFSEMMGLPANQLSTSYMMPWYNNVDLNTQLRFAVP